MGKQYLVLRPFTSYGQFFKKGQLVDESEIRSPHLRLSEHKIILAVSSAKVPEVPEEAIVEAETPVLPKEDTDTTPDETPETTVEKKGFSLFTPKA